MSDTKNIGEALKDLHGEESGRDTILCVDDLEMLRNTLGRMAGMVVRGLNVETADGYEEAIDKASGDLRGRLALVITDTEMPPGKNGMELAKALKGKNATPEILKDMQRVPVIINSGNSNYEHPRYEDGAAMQALLESGAADVFLAKPFMPDELREAILEAINRVRERGEK
ncbi:MAG: response regulator [Nitrospirae bacterium]|nr:response regulator [Nitrospirota bacterium]